jgi:hypothetical protein
MSCQVATLNDPDLLAVDTGIKDLAVQFSGAGRGA